MQLEGIHHVTCITGDAPGNVAFYTGVLGLRLVKKTVNQDDPFVYHLFYADEQGSAGADITFFEYPGARHGRAGAGMVHRVTFRVASDEAVDFWESRLGEHGVRATREPGALRFEDPEGLGLELAVSDVPDEPLVARHPEIPEAYALQGFGGVCAFVPDPERSRGLLEEVMGFHPTGDASWELRGRARGGLYAYDAPPSSGLGVPGAGTVHHVAWSSTMEDHQAWQRRVTEAGMHATPVIDRFWFRSVYFREPGGVLFELATLGPGFGIDEDPAHLGEKLILPPAFEHLRPRVEQELTPLPDPRVAWTT
jgi:glyoxalase family protein